MTPLGEGSVTSVDVALSRPRSAYQVLDAVERRITRWMKLALKDEEGDYSISNLMDLAENVTAGGETLLRMIRRFRKVALG